MKTSRIYSIAAVSILLVIGGAAFAFAQAPSKIHPPILYPGATLVENGEKLAANRAKVEEVKKNIAIMEKVFDHVMDKEFGGDYVSEGFFSEGCRGYWIPGSGLLFMMNVKFPLKVDMAREERQVKEEPEDLWEEFEEQVESGKKPRARKFFFDHANREERVKEIHKKIDRLVTQVINT
ncbi:hypothetical protein GF373_05115, partial [bacterium]|nr:hypothetical protein [bacterium]